MAPYKFDWTATISGTIGIDAENGIEASELFNKFKPTPQILENIEVKDKSIINSPKCKKAINEANKIIKNRGRILVRKSGTEPKIRIMSESEDSNLNKLCVNIIKKSIQ